jgi:Pyruvate/2-oxoacid:ferredoxin oxidoreductase gamma subunit
VNNEEWSAIQYRFLESIDLLAAFDQTEIEHLEVSNERTIVIYSRTIFDLEVDDGSLADARLATVEVFDASPDHSMTDVPDPVALTEPLIEELAVTIGVDWERC